VSSPGRAAGARTSPIRRQGAFLHDLGIGARAASLSRARPDQAGKIARQLQRLIAQDQMGQLFKVAGVHSTGLGLPGFAAS